MPYLAHQGSIHRGPQTRAWNPWFRVQPRIGGGTSRQSPLFNDRPRFLVTGHRDALINKPGKLDALAENAGQTARRGEIIQQGVDRADNSGATRKQGGAMQGGARQYPDSFP